MAAATVRTQLAAVSIAATRISSLDIVRGAVMVLMAIDHVRVYSGVPAGGPTYGVFFTRWVTHFCAPAFVFLAGTAAFLAGQKLHDAGRLSRYLATRGLLLVVLELTVIRASWTFGVDYSQFILAGVIWMLGWCMILLAALVRLPVPAIGVLGLVVIAFQNIFTPIGKALPASLHPVWEFIYPVGAEVSLGPGGPAVSVLYTLVPWVGVMAAGYAFGTIMTRDLAQRRRLCLQIGLSATVLFVVLAGIGLVVHPATAGAPPALIRFLNQTKYPASPLFLLMTLGPTIALIAVAERVHGWIAGVLATFGRVPMFYYLLHIPLIHATALLVWLIRDGSVHAERFATAPYVSIAPQDRWSLALLYVVFAVVVAALYPLCRWYGHLKSTSRGAWLRYI
jgi:uncharacterized membrane protein